MAEAVHYLIGTSDLTLPGLLIFRRRRQGSHPSPLEWLKRLTLLSRHTSVHHSSLLPLLPASQRRNRLQRLTRSNAPPFPSPSLSLSSILSHPTLTHTPVLPTAGPPRIHFKASIIKEEYASGQCHCVLQHRHILTQRRPNVVNGTRLRQPFMRLPSRTRRRRARTGRIWLRCLPPLPLPPSLLPSPLSLSLSRSAPPPDHTLLQTTRTTSACMLVCLNNHTSPRDRHPRSSSFARHASFLAQDGKENGAEREALCVLKDQRRAQ